MVWTLRKHLNAGDVFLQAVVQLLEAQSARHVACPERDEQLPLIIIVIIVRIASRHVARP